MGEPVMPVLGRKVRVPAWIAGAASAILSGAFMASAYAPFDWHAAAWFAMVPFLVVLPWLRSDHAWCCGFLMAVIFYRIGLDWVFGIHGPLAVSGLVVLSIWMGLAFRVAKMLMDRLGRSVMLWAVPLAFVGQEVIRCEALPRLRFPFLAVGYSQAGNLWIAQIASIGGVYLLSLLVVAMNVAIAYAVIERRRRALLPAASVAMLILLLGAISQPQASANPARVPVACVQAEDGGIGQYTQLTRTALEHATVPRLVVLPEHTISEWATDRHPLLRALGELAAGHRAFICVGAHVQSPPGSRCDYENVGMMLGPDGKLAAMQAKSVPLPFFNDGEPARNLEPIAMPPYGQAGMLVCYDALFTDHARRLVNRGAGLLVVPVMDPERWRDQERLQHAAMAPLRSIELRRWAVRAASSGVSQIIDPAGRVRAIRTKSDGPGILLGDVQFLSQQTVFARAGWVIAPLCGAAFLGLVAVLTVVDWRERWRTAKDE